MRLSRSDRAFDVLNYLVLACISLTCLLPIVHLIAVSFSDAHEVLSGNVSLWPVNFTFEPYKVLVKGTSIVRAFVNSLVITVVGVCLSMLFTVLAAYPLSKSYFIGRRFYSLAVIFTMLFGGGLIPTYLTVKTLGLINSYWSLWMLGLISVFNLLVMKSYFEGLPDELEEAGRIDGCGEWRMLVQIVLPLSMPMLAAIALFYGVGFWNSFMNVLIYITDSTKVNLPVLVQQMLRSQTFLAEMSYERPEDSAMLTPESVRAAGLMVMILPMLIVYPFIQKYFVKGVLIGAVKG
ncbi:carbohydrate ABC transporter permease [Paenibacillus sp. HJGM_3]|uniref:carbohydrate ABC transporter permease n=1 Tax=Paenibacillus sp. HJGM_3 TaxID=3379816 RepID=UPI00385F96E8